MTYPKFMEDVEKMNKIFELPLVLNLEDAHQRLMDFRDILTEECGEIDAVAGPMLKKRTELADLLGDIIVYCASEAKRWNIPIDQVLQIIMASNFSKLDDDGKPIKDARGKFLKGPNYWRPEPHIAALLRGIQVDEEDEPIPAATPPSSQQP